MARKSVEVGFGILAAYSVGYIFEVVMAALRLHGVPPYPQFDTIQNTPKSPRRSRGRLGSAALKARRGVGGLEAPKEMKTHNPTNDI